MTSYAEVAKTDNNTQNISTAKEFVPKDTVILNISDIMGITEKEVIEALRDMELWNTDLDIGIQRRGDKVEIVSKSEEFKQKLYNNGLNVNGYLIQANTDMPMFVNVSLMGIPLELPEEYVTAVLTNYGEISGNFFVKKRMYNTVYKNGIRVYQFRKLEKDIPQFIQIMGNKVKTIYTGQKKFEKKKFVDVAENQRVANEATCSKNPDPVDLGEALKSNNVILKNNETKEKTNDKNGKKRKKKNVESEENLESTRLVIVEKPITESVIPVENEVDMEVLSSKQTLEDDLHITSDEEDILTDKRKSEIKKKQKIMTNTRNFKERKKYSSSEEDGNTIISKVKKSRKINIEFMIKMLYAAEFRNTTFTDLIDGARQQVQFKAHILFLTQGAYPEVDEEVQQLHVPEDVYKLWKRIKYREPTIVEKHVNSHLEDINKKLKLKGKDW